MKYNIVLTDCATVNAGDLDLTMLEEFGNVSYYGETRPEKINERIKDAHIIILNKTVIGKNEIDAAFVCRHLPSFIRLHLNLTTLK